MTAGACKACGGFDPLDGRTPVCRCGTAWAQRPRKAMTRRAPLGPGTKGLARGKGLAAGKGLTRSTPMAAGKPPARSMTPAGQRSAMSRSANKAKPKPQAPRVAGEVRDAVRVRSGGRCEAGVLVDCRRRGRTLDAPGVGGNQHHRRPGQMGGDKAAGTHEASNLLDVCGAGNTSGCHGWIESNRHAAYALGLLVRRGEDPAATPVRLWDGRRVLLDDTGGYLPVTTAGVPTS